MKLLLAALLVAALAVPASGSFINSGEVIARDGNGQLITNTFFQHAGDCVVDAIALTTIAIGDEPTAADSVDVAISSGGMPGWLMLQVPEETNLSVAFIRFKESVSGMDHSYTWGDWCPLFIGGEYREFAFNCGLWDSCHITLGASVNCVVDAFYWRMELISAD